MNSYKLNTAHQTHYYAVSLDYGENLHTEYNGEFWNRLYCLPSLL